ncbi:14-3-3 protein domain-containing protein [Ditylenchus destructor]|uniref:14-3-3 protein domain-containing protein n=1 Tax=Ditylenchus destructor TaxID=166010 RepID=A0AAD4MPZ6_9BILA|nr:14-3-3 protein domain-containing protein [Ditylenchus destructor]
MECNSKNDAAASQPSWWDSWWKNREQRRMAKTKHDEEKFVETAKIYQQADRWEDMAQVMRKVVKLCYAQKKDLSAEERSFLLDAYNHLIESRMNSWRRLRAAENHLLVSLPSGDVSADLDPKAKDDTKLLNEEIFEVRKERRDVEWEIREICEAMIRLQDDFLIPLASIDSACELYLDVRKRYYKYLEEIGAPQDINDVFFYSF